MADTPLPSSFDSDPDFYEENRIRKFFKRLKSEPLVPLGIGITCWALVNAARSVKSGNSIRTNRFFRYRLYAQGFTIVAMLGGTVYYRADRLKHTEYVKLMDKQKAQEKREKWIKELEARDAEDKMWREKLGKIHDMQREEEERLLIEEARQKRMKATDDGEGVVTKLKKDIKKEIGEKKKKGDIAGRAENEKKAEPAEPEPEEKYVSILGEREEGGFLGHKHVAGFYEHRFKPMVDSYFPQKNTGEGSEENPGAENSNDRPGTESSEKK